MEISSESEVPWGENFDFFPRWRLQVNLKFHEGRNLISPQLLEASTESEILKLGWNFDIGRPLRRLQVSLKFHGGGNFDIISTSWRLKATLKFHGDGNCDIISTLWRLQASLKFHGSMGVGIWISPYPGGVFK